MKVEIKENKIKEESIAQGSLPVAADEEIKSLPVVALNGLVLFPDYKIHFDLIDSKAIAAIDNAVKNHSEIFAVCMKDPSVKTITADNIFDVGVVARLNQVVKGPIKGLIHVSLTGVTRAKIDELHEGKRFFTASVDEIAEREPESGEETYAKALVRKTKEAFSGYLSVAGPVVVPLAAKALLMEKPGEMADYIASNIIPDFINRQTVLEIFDPIERLAVVNEMLLTESDVLSLENDIEEKVHSRFDEHQRESFLHEQMRAISDELNGFDAMGEIEKYREKIKKLKASDEVKAALNKECDRLMRSSDQGYESNVIRDYIERCLALPWGKYSKEQSNIIKSKKILENDHYGLEKVKERIIEYLSVCAIAPDIRGQIICLVGPPGVGKTSIARSIARATGRKYQRISLGGVHDEAEIRGHRRTYIGSMPGRIMSAVEKAGTANPLILLDEIDKLANDHRGDPTSALLEVLDPEQNSTFTDHYIDLPFDLGKVMFITTANDRSMIPGPLQDRMEIIELSSYTREEKFHIAKNHLIAKQLKAHGLKASGLKITDDAIMGLIDSYTREAGVRALEQKIAALCRKCAARRAMGDEKKMTVGNKDLESLLGVRKFKSDDITGESEVGVVNGLAWTSVGGEMLEAEVAVLDGTGKIELTGSLGDVMQESAKAAVSYIRSMAKELGIDNEFYKNKDIHIHFPEGAVPKDGPSAGVTISTALVSALTNKKVRKDVAMTGEISLRGRILPIGGLREKSMAAYRNGMKTVIIPEKNLPDLEEVDEKVKENIAFVPVKTAREAWDVALDSRC